MSFVRVPTDTLSDADVEKAGLDTIVKYLEPILTGQDSFYMTSIHFAKTIHALKFTFTHRFAEQEVWNYNSEEYKRFAQMMKDECPRLKRFTTFQIALGLYPTLVRLGHIDAVVH